MATDGLYKDVLMDHFRNPRNKGDLDHEQTEVKQVENPTLQAARTT